MSDDMSDEDHQKFISILTQTIIPFMVTSIITIVSYGYLWYYIWQNRKFVKNNSNTMKSMLNQREYNTTVTLFLVCFCYFVFVLPIIIMQIIGDLGPDKSIDPRGKYPFSFSKEKNIHFSTTVFSSFFLCHSLSWSVLSLLVPV